MRGYDPLAVAVGASSSLLLFLASALGGASAFAAFGPPGDGGAYSGSCGFLSVPQKSFGCKPPRRDGNGLLQPSARRRASCHILLATSSDDDDATAEPRRGGRRKVSDEEMEERKEQLRELLCATKAEIDKLVRKIPIVLQYSDVVESHGPKVALLRKRLGISQKEAGRLCLQRGRILCNSLETLEGKIDWLQARLHLNKAQLLKLIILNPATLTYSIEENLQPTLENIQSLLELSDKELTKMVVRQPTLLDHNYSTEKLAARLSLLQNLVNVEENDLATLRKAIINQPNILHWSEDRMVETQHWIAKRLGLGNARIAQMCRNFPAVLLSNFETLEEKVDWVQAAMSLSDEELGELFGKFPNLFGCCPKKNLEPKLRYLRKRLELDDQGLKNLVTKRPGLFSASEKAIEEKIFFYSELVGESEAKRIVTKSSNLLVGSVSLEKRLKPRLSEVQKAGTKVVWSEKLIQRLARRTDDQWERYGLGEAPRGRRRSSD